MASSRIFITGSTGFIGSHVVALALESGYSVRLSVRKESQIQELKTRFHSHGDRLEVLLLSDITDASAVGAALDGVEYVFHLASPMPGKGSDFQSGYVDPAVRGTKAILQAAASAPSVQRVIIVSSILALIPLDGLTKPGLEVHENSNESIPLDANMPFPEGFIGHALKYQASKILAHRATVNWIVENKPGFDLLTLHPALVVGNDMNQADATPTGMNALLMQSLMSDKPLIPSSLVDVRDVALAHLRALKAPISGQGSVTEFILCGKPFDWAELVAFVQKKYPEFPLKLTGPFHQGLTPDTKRAERDLGIEWRGLEDMVSTVLDQQIGLQQKAAL
ncbi:hypothetical protein LCI18_013822 [Fusarium solani-melongenae]|uniref:Uncharacterized protein n=1 Tax=Fusarium solani subsp. cucurbitae TaxID=2747967 RepID=A0ACD3ZNW6_FUSSC|nr:hypothetical protein LCI18_013822 [Fusarium solani-melongenae]